MTVDVRPAPDLIDVTDALLDEPDVERAGHCWYARHPQALLHAPHGVPEDALDTLRAWVASNDTNVRRQHPFCVGVERDGSCYWSFDYAFRRRIAPTWWLEAGARWCATQGGRTHHGQ